MKKLVKILFLFLFVFCTFTLVACEGEKPMQDKYDCISLAEANRIALEAGEDGSKEAYYVYGKIEKINNPKFGDLIITDGKESLHVFRTVDESGVLYEELADKPYTGDDVVLYGTLKTFRDQPEMAEGVIKDIRHNEPDIKPDNYEPMNIGDLRASEPNKNVQLTGVVAKITYANGMKPNGFYLVDNTGATYVYGSTACEKIKEGSMITLVGKSTLYVNPKEEGFAQKYNYPGSFQITDATVTEVSEGNNFVPNFDWVKDTSIKVLIENDDFVNVTGNIFKVRGTINKQVNPGFTNYYINDLDDVTGSYTYSSCNGEDFSYLDQYDGKLCDIYLSVINCKCTESGLIRRFIPVKVTPTTLSLSDQEVTDFVFEYYVKEQFDKSFNASTTIDLLNKFENKHIDLSSLKIEYTSLAADLVSIDSSTDIVKLTTLKAGDASVKVIITYNEFNKEYVVNFKIAEASDIKTITIKEAINSTDNTTVTVKGIIMSSLVNRTGFYLQDDSGMIAVTTDAETMADLSLGNEIVLTGVRIHKKKDTTGAEIVGQSVIADAKVLSNDYMNHEYSTANFDNTLTLDDLYAFGVNEDVTTNVYVVKAKIKVVKSPYSTNIYLCSLTNPDVELGLYCSSAKQYGFLLDFENQEVTLELALCNWNDKTHYKACVISVSDGNNKIVNSLNFNK